MEIHKTKDMGLGFAPTDDYWVELYETDAGEFVVRVAEWVQADLYHLRSFSDKELVLEYFDQMKKDAESDMPWSKFWKAHGWLFWKPCVVCGQVFVDVYKQVCEECRAKFTWEG